MSQLTSNLSYINAIKSDIKSAIEAKGVDMTGYSFPDYPAAISQISTGGELGYISISQNGFYDATQSGVDGFAWVEVSVPQSVTEKDITERNFPIVDLNNGASLAAAYAFYRDSTLSTVNLPYCSKVLTSAFCRCTSLTQVSLPTCTSIETGGFSGCASLTQVNIPACATVGAHAFRSCSLLSQISLPVCKNISNQAFYDTALESLTLCTDVYWTVPYGINALANTPLAGGTGSIYVRSELYNYWITSTGWSSLSDRFVSISYSEPILSYSDGLVYGSTSALYSGFQTYLGISSGDITAISLSASMIGEGTFKNCTNLTYISIPYCESIGNSAFYSCKNVSVLWCPDMSYLGWIDLRYTGITDVYANNCQVLNEHNFYNCSSLSKISIVFCTSIGTEVFSGCTALSEISLPFCSYIGMCAFFGCTSLTKITLGYNSVCVMEQLQTFYGGPIDFSIGTGSIYVPSHLVDAYKTANNWSRYSSQIFPIE